MDLEIGFSKKAPDNLDELLTTIFWKKPSMAANARIFLEYIREWS